MFGQDLTTVATEGIVPEWVGVDERYFDSMLVEFVDLLDILIAAAGHSAGGGVGGVLPGKDYIVGGEGFAIVPHHPLLQAPTDRHAVPRQALIVETRNFLR